ncbi:golgin subfamily A member 6-like protein 22 [Dendronephthya gigantea]|uniref:golgin subfamily A member 6-like protein 22 n=1 Tax=Dendronephthya gigantea TaxID=151771 RepID=UPI00106ADE2E|nr:golgin subfamily A member 6-like protein 22 [Dendronephthya gigantea]
MFYSSRKASSSTARKQTSVTSKRNHYSDVNRGGNDIDKYDDGNKSGNDTDFGSAELLSTSREDLSPSRCSCQSGGSNVAVRNETRDLDNEHFWSGNLRLEFDNNGGSDDEQLKDELLRIFDRERLGLETYFKQKTENILAGYRRKQYEWEEKIRSERMEYEKTLAQDKIEIQQNYISEMAKITKQFNQERLELESHYKKQIEELSQQFEFRKKEMDATIIKERTELKERLEIEYQAMLKSQKSADEQRYNQQIMDLEETYKRNLLEQEQKLKDSFFEGELSGRRLQSDMEAKFEQEKSIIIAEWKKRVELLEVELGKEKDRANREERKVCESHRNELSQKDVELEKQRQVVETLKLELSHKDKAAKEHEIFQQNIFLRGCDALPGKLREDFEKLLAAHREKLEKNLRKEEEGRNIERDARMALERETLEKQLKVERDQMKLDLEKERVEMRHSIREKEDKMRQETREETERMRTRLESEREHIRNEVIKEQKETFIKEKETRDAEIKREKEILRDQIRKECIQQQQETLLKEKELLREQVKYELKMNDKQVNDERTQSRFISQEEKKSKTREQMNEELADHRSHPKFETEQAGKRNGFGQDKDEMWDADASQKRKHTKQWVEGQYRFKNYNQGYKEDSAGLVDQFEIDDKGSHTGQSYGEQDCSKETTEENKNNNEGLLKSEDNSGCQKSDIFRNKDGYLHSTNTSKDPEYNLRSLREENEGLKAKVCALQDNISLHECFKMEASDEVQRLRKTNKDLKMKLEELEKSLKDEDEVKKTLQEYKLQIKNYEKQFKKNEEKITEYEEICAEYERSLQECRKKIMVFDNDSKSSPANRSESRGDKKHWSGNPKISKDGRNNGLGLLNSGDDGLKGDPGEEIMDNILEDRQTELNKLVPSLEEKLKWMEKKISEITVTNQQINTDSMKKVRLSSDLEKLQTQNKGLVNKLKTIQWQLQAMVDKLRKKKKKIAKLKNENIMLKTSHQRDISVLQQKLEYSNQIISRLQDEFSTESSQISRLREEISNINRKMIEERVCEQRMIRARSIEEIEKLRDLDREKIDLQRKLNEVKTALDGYSERLKNKLSFSETTSSQLSLNAGTTVVRDLQLTETLQALEASRRASHRQNERLQHEKNELQIMMSSLCKSKEDLREIDGFHTHKEHQLSPCSSISSLSSSCMSSLDGRRTSGFGMGTKFSSTFSIFD